MENLYWEPYILSRCVGYKNLSGAADHVGLSQPQLSRIVSKLENELGLVLLDRSSRRKSGWTSHAIKLAQVFSKMKNQLEAEIQRINFDSEPKKIRMATLEGLAFLACQYSQYLFSERVKTIEVDVHDTDLLEELFYKGNYDLIFTSREPGKKKYKYRIEIGRQSLDLLSKGVKTQVLSSFEYHSHGTEENKFVFVSNSLEVRKHWIDHFGGEGFFPSKIKSLHSNSGSSVPVLLMGADYLSPITWNKILSFKPKI